MVTNFKHILCLRHMITSQFRTNFDFIHIILIPSLEPIHNTFVVLEEGMHRVFLVQCWRREHIGFLWFWWVCSVGGWNAQSFLFFIGLQCCFGFLGFAVLLGLEHRELCRLVVAWDWCSMDWFPSSWHSLEWLIVIMQF